MSRREGRDSDSKRYRSRSDREPSPKRYRREDERKNEKPSNKTQLDKDADENRKFRQSFPDPHTKAPLPPRPESETVALMKETEKKVERHKDATKHLTDPSKVEWSRTYFQQHDDRATISQSGRSISRRSEREVGPWRYSRDHLNGREETYPCRRNEAYEHNKKEDRVWRHDGFFEMEANPKPVVSKRPSFREQKTQPEPTSLGDKIVANPVARNPHDHSMDAGRRDQRWHSSDRSYRPERSLARDTELGRGEPWGERHGGSRFRGRERLPPRQDYRPTGGFVEKWKHDLYDEANKSPPPKNEEDQISKIEALLAS